MGVEEQRGEERGRKNCDQTGKKYLFILENNSALVITIIISNIHRLTKNPVLGTRTLFLIR